MIESAAPVGRSAEICEAAFKRAALFVAEGSLPTAREFMII